MSNTDSSDANDLSSFDSFDDDDVIDLLDVVAPGKGEAQLQANAQGSEFAPFPDPTPEDHVVDPHEELQMPDMDDLESLLKSLGAEKTAPPKAPEGGKAQAAQVAEADEDADMFGASLGDDPEELAAPASSDALDADSLLNELLGGGPAAAPEGAPAKGAPVESAAPAVPLDDEFESMLGDMAASASLVPSPEAEAHHKPAIPEESAQDFAADVMDDDHMRKLDAMLDTMLADAPPTPPAAAPVAPAKNAAVAEPVKKAPAATPVAGPEAAALAQLQEQCAAQAERIADLEKTVAEASAGQEALATQAERIADLEKAVAEATAGQEALATQAERIADLEKAVAEATAGQEALATQAERIADLEKAVAEATAGQETLATQAERIADLEKAVAEATTGQEAGGAQAERIAVLEKAVAEATAGHEEHTAQAARIAALEKVVAEAAAAQEAVAAQAERIAELTMAVDALQQPEGAHEQDLEKMVATVAARVIREELVPLLQGNAL